MPFSYTRTKGASHGAAFRLTFKFKIVYSYEEAEVKCFALVALESDLASYNDVHSHLEYQSKCIILLI